MLTLTAVFLLIAVILYYKRKFKYWKNKRVVFDEPELFFGNYRDFMLLKKGVWEVDLIKYNKYKNEKFIGTFIGQKPALIIKDPDIVKLIMSKDFYYFYHRGIIPNEREILSMNLFSASGDIWKVYRQHLTPLFSSAKMKNMFYLIMDCCEQFEKFVDSKVAKSDGLNVRELTSILTIDVIGSCAFGLKTEVMHKENNSFRVVSLKIFQPSVMKSVRQLLRALFPKIYHLLKLRVSEKEVVDFFTNLVNSVMAIRKLSNEKRHDFIELMMGLHEEGVISGDGIESLIDKESKKVVLPVDINMVTAQCFVFFAAGFETSSTTMSYALHHIALDEEVQKKVHQEIDVMISRNGVNLTYENVIEMRYLDMVISETLRFHPVLPNITRKCTAPYKVPDSDLVIDKDTMIHIPVYAIHHDPKYYPNPEKFIPERFTKEEKEKRPRFTYLPFGEGQRICIGMRFGKLQAMAGIISIMKKYKVQPTDKSNEPMAYNSKTGILTPKHGIWLKFVPRE